MQSAEHPGPRRPATPSRGDDTSLWGFGRQRGRIGSPDIRLNTSAAKVFDHRYAQRSVTLRDLSEAFALLAAAGGVANMDIGAHRVERLRELGEQRVQEHCTEPIAAMLWSDRNTQFRHRRPGSIDTQRRADHTPTAGTACSSRPPCRRPGRSRQPRVKRRSARAQPRRWTRSRC